MWCARDVAFGLENLGVPHEDMIPRIDAALAAVRLTERASFAPHMLSGGQKQRVAVPAYWPCSRKS